VLYSEVRKRGVKKLLKIAGSGIFNPNQPPNGSIPGRQGHTFLYAVDE
jgi:hypothetical protein